MPPANDITFARSQDNSSNVSLVILVVAAVFGVRAAALDCFNLVHLTPADLQDETRFTILAFALCSVQVQ